MKRALIAFTLAGLASCGGEAPVTEPDASPTAAPASTAPASTAPASTAPQNLYDLVPECFETAPATPVYSIKDTDYCD